MMMLLAMMFDRRVSMAAFDASIAVIHYRRVSPNGGKKYVILRLSKSFIDRSESDEPQRRTDRHQRRWQNPQRCGRQPADKRGSQPKR